ncbi:MAG: PHP N-terminal domain protein [Candidatus Ozemobacter sibiricus]|jgi:predicted metal-dependent phosphoesterase TrpH/energy-coupling factor transporter ATP-binding protein EcfA2|uniref:PHP N-terminal domain protein n=1 Tax=Candidatus Ozemobacter sibiricus TaxID=2268124 RepID=A0A367ZIW1_9BACT|nr:MAG: PHP N-terminal domain protein [Candidatus Ozemobacter sibiricus]
MTWQADPLEEALSLPNGARFYRCALQINSHHYASTYRGVEGPEDAEAHARQIVAKAVDLGISVLAITDHNHLGGIAPFRKAAKDRAIHVFPGFELTSREGVHVLCMYSPAIDEDCLQRYLGEFGIRDASPNAEASTKYLAEILRCVREQGGVTIAAHVTNKGGLLEMLHGQARINAWKDENLLAIQIPGRVEDLPKHHRAIVENKNADYRRARDAGNGLAVAVVNARDVATAKDLEDPSATCWIKMSEVSVEALRQAFLDAGSRIRLNADPLPEPHTEFVAMAWEGGFLDGAAIHFNENLNVLIGGRGTGKSTIIESLRSVLGLEPLGEEARQAHAGIVQNVLRNGTKISLLVRSPRPNVQEYRIERTIPHPPVVRDRNGNVLPLAPSDVVPLVEVYGQHEIAELTRRPDKLTQLLERFVARDTTLAQRKSEVRKQLEQSRTKILAVAGERRHIEERLAGLPALEETLKRFQEAGLEDRLKDQSLLVREERIFETADDRLAAYRQVLDDLRQALPIDRVFVSEKALDGLPGRPILAEIETVLADLGHDLDAVAERFQAALERAEKRLAAVKTVWEERQKAGQAAYEKILRELQKGSLDGEEFIRLRRRIEELRPLRERHDLLRRALKEHEDRRQRLLAEWEEVKAEEFRQLERAAAEVNRRLVGRVRVRVNMAGDREPLCRFLKDRVGGRLSETLDMLRQTPNLSLKEFVDALRLGRDHLVQNDRWPAGQAERLAQMSAEVVMELEELELPHTTQIELNLAVEGQPAQWQTLDRLSTGQKATAVLLLLLLESDAPLVVDQPEDDLDNRFVTEGVVPKMREEKRRRQFVFATHNANIPVLGDAELIVGLNPSHEAEREGPARLRQEHMGSIDARAVRELVEEVLEGGRAAFEMRRLKYGF